MASTAASDPQVAAMRILAALEELLDRHAGRPDEERQATLVTALRDLMNEIPDAERGPTIQALRALLPPDEVVRDVEAGATSARVLELEDEVARLREELRAKPAPAPAATAASPELVARLARMLQVGARELEAAAPADLEARLADTLALLVDFAIGLLRAYIPVTQDEDRTVAGLVQRVVADAVLGRGDPDGLAAHVERTRRQIGGQVLAFRRACEEGARSVLKGLTPAVIESEAARNASFIERKLGGATQCWEAYQKRFDEIRAATDLYQTHFDGPLRREMHRLALGADTKRTS
jgi:hypothetical protein